MANAVNSIARSVGQALGSTLAVTLIAAGFDPATGFPRDVAFTLVALIGAVASVAVLVVAVVGLWADRRHGTGHRPDPLAPVRRRRRAPANGRRCPAFAEPLPARPAWNRTVRGIPRRTSRTAPTGGPPWPDPPARTAAPTETGSRGTGRGDPAPETDEISGTRADYAPMGADPKPTTGGTIKRTLKEFSEDNLTDWAAALTYYGVLALFPALIALLSIVGLLTDPQKLTDALTAVVPAQRRRHAQPGDRADRRATPRPPASA